jgi:hypothetical protein
MGGHFVNVTLLNVRPGQWLKKIRVGSSIWWSEVIGRAHNTASPEQERPIASTGTKLDDRSIAG